MAIDYSKWDKIELSDDSDVEVHPNVDKRSFIRWKQRDIHEKRTQRNVEIKSILVQLTMYAKLNKRVDYLLDKLSDQELLDKDTVMQKLNAKFDPREKFDYEKLKEEKGNDLRKGLRDLSFDSVEIENTPPYNEMIEDLFVQIKEDHPGCETDGKLLVKYLKEHRAKIDDVLSKQSIRLDELLYQKSMLISSDDIHTGFDRSFMNKDQAEADAQKTIQPEKKQEVIEVINDTSSKDSSKEEKDMLDELTVLPATAEFAKIPLNDLQKCADYLIKHPNICTENQKDALIMTAFDHQLEGNSNEAKQIIHQSLLLQYISQLAGKHFNKDQVIKSIKLFCTKVSEDSRAKAGFYQDVENTFNHIKMRCEIIKKEQEEKGAVDGEELIQLKALDDSTELVVNIPEEGSKEYEIFTTLPKEMQEAVRTESLDEVNQVFATMKIDEAEKVLDVINECGIIGINGYLEDEDKFQELKKQYNEKEPRDDNSSGDEKELGFQDTVD